MQGPTYAKPSHVSFRQETRDKHIFATACLLWATGRQLTTALYLFGTALQEKTPTDIGFLPIPWSHNGRRQNTVACQMPKNKGFINSTAFTLPGGEMLSNAHFFSEETCHGNIPESLQPGNNQK
jgi:hypothetical protein